MNPLFIQLQTGYGLYSDHETNGQNLKDHKQGPVYY